MNAILLNPEVIAINQMASEPGDILIEAIATNGDKPAQLWSRKIVDGSGLYIGIVNFASSAERVTFPFTALDFDGWGNHTKLTARDLWARKELGEFVASMTVAVDSHDTAVLRLTGC